MFRPEFLLPAPAALADPGRAVDLEMLPEHISLGGQELRIVTDAIVRIREAAKNNAPPAHLHYPSPDIS